MNRVSNVLGVLSIIFFLSACGGGKETDPTTVDSANKSLSVIYSYANGASRELPILEDYHNVGANEVTASNLNDINILVHSVDRTKVDTEEEVRALFNNYQTAMQHFEQESSEHTQSSILNQSDYEAIGIKDVTSKNIDAINAIIDKKNPAEVDSIEEIRALVNAYIASTDAPEKASDHIKPVITLSGSATVIIMKGTTYTDAGATASDNADGDITSQIQTVNPVDTATAGTYTITYNVTDSAGNIADTITRVITVEVDGNKETEGNKDIEKPVIKLNGDATVTLYVGDTYKERGAGARDDVDGGVAVKTTGTVDTHTEGTYIIIYTAVDKAGNKATKTRTVKVKKVVNSITNEVHIDGSDKKYTSIQEAVDAAKDGDTILIKDGLYKAGIKINKNNITIKKADGANNVVISGEKAVTGWEYDDARELYYAPAPNECSNVQMLFVKGKEQNASRYPKKAQTYFELARNSTSKSEFTLKEFSANTAYMKDAMAHIKTNAYRVSARRVESVKNNHDINLTSAIDTNYKKGVITTSFKVFFTQVLGAIDEENEWAWNNNKIYIKSDNEPEDVTVACSEYGIYLDSEARNTKISGLQITKIKGHGITKKKYTRFKKEHDLIIENNTISYVSGRGISLHDSLSNESHPYWVLPSDTLIKNNEIHHARTGGIELYADNALVEGNYVHDIGASKLDDDALTEGEKDGFLVIGIYIKNSTGAVVRNNRVDKIGYCGIALSNFWSSQVINGGRVVENNYVTNTLLTLSDGGAIYTIINKGTTKATNKNNQKTIANFHKEYAEANTTRDIIRNNIIDAAIGSAKGIADPDFSSRWGFGIYLDEASDLTDIYDNLVMHSTRSFFAHMLYDTNVTNNTFILPKQSNIFIAYDNMDDELFGYDNVVFDNNKILSADKFTYQLIEVFRDGYNYLKNSNNNIIRTNTDADSKIRIINGYGTFESNTNISLAEWKGYGYDDGSQIIEDNTKPVVLINPLMMKGKAFYNLEGCRKFDDTPLGTSAKELGPYGYLVLFGCDHYEAGTYRKSN